MSNHIESGTPGGDLDWQHLYETHAPLVRHHAAKLVDPSHVDDIVQETFLRAYRNRHAIRPGRPLAPWLTVIARRAAIDAVRREHSRDRLARRLATPARSPEPVEDDFFNEVRRGSIQDAFTALNERHRRVLAEVVIRGGRDEAEDALDNTTRSVVARARRRFRDRYLELARTTGVFGGIVGGLRRRSASRRDAWARAEGWLHVGMPIFLATCSGASLAGDSASLQVAAHAAAAGVHRDGTPDVARMTGERPLSAWTLSLTSGPVPSPQSGHWQARSPDARTISAATLTSVDWRAGREGDRAGIHLSSRTQTSFSDTNEYFGIEMHCSGSVTGATMCRAWDEVPESRRHHDVGVDDAGGGVELTR